MQTGTLERARAQELGMQQRACACTKGKQQPLDGVVARGVSADAQRRDGVAGRARGALDDCDGDRGGDGEEQAAEALVAQRRAAAARSAAAAPKALRGAGGGALWLATVGIWVE